MQDCTKDLRLTVHIYNSSSLVGSMKKFHNQYHQLNIGEYILKDKCRSSRKTQGKSIYFFFQLGEQQIIYIYILRFSYSNRSFSFTYPAIFLWNRRLVYAREWNASIIIENKLNLISLDKIIITTYFVKVNLTYLQDYNV